MSNDRNFSLTRHPIVSLAMTNMTGPAAALMVSPVLARELGASGRGEYAAITTTLTILGLIGTLGYQDALAYRVGQAGLSVRLALRVTLLITIPLALLAAIVLFILADRILPAEYVTSASMFGALVASLLIQIVLNLVVGVATGSGNASAVNRLKLYPTLIRTVMVLAACALFDLQAFEAALILLLSPVAGLAVVVPMMFRVRTVGRARKDSRVSFSDLSRYAILTLPGIVAGASVMRVDQMLGLPVIGAHELGLYAVAVTFAELPLLFTTALRTYLLGLSSSGDDFARQVRASRAVIFANLILCALLSVLAQGIIPLVFGQDFAGAVLPAIVLLAGTAIYAAVIASTAVMLTSGRAASQSATLVLGAGVGIGGFFLLRDLGALGAAIGSACGYAASAIVAAIVLRRGSIGMSRLLMLHREDLAAVRDRVLRDRGK